MGIVSDKITKEIRSNEFSPNRFITLLMRRNSSLGDVRDAYMHTINVL